MALRAFALLVALSLLGCGTRPRPLDPHRWLGLAPAARTARRARELGTDFRYVRVPGARVRFVEVPAPDGTEARPILFVHGIGGGMGDLGPVSACSRST